MTKNQKQSRERHIRRGLAHLMAGQIVAMQNFLGLPKSAANLANLDRELRKACAAWIICISSYLDHPADFLRMVAESLDGKLHGARYDAALEEAYRRAKKTGKRKGERSNPWRPLFSEVDDALAFVLTELSYRDRPTKDGLRVRLKILGRRLSKKQGRHRKRKLPRPEITRNRGKG